MIERLDVLPVDLAAVHKFIADTAFGGFSIGLSDFKKQLSIQVVSGFFVSRLSIYFCRFMTAVC
jgi:hypothetical protein